jgi:hypothetical protein
MITILLLIAITWILWNIQQNLAETNDRQRNVAESLEKLAITLSNTEPVTGTSNNAKTTKTSAISPSTEKNRFKFC